MQRTIIAVIVGMAVAAPTAGRPESAPTSGGSYPTTLGEAHLVFPCQPEPPRDAGPGTHILSCRVGDAAYTASAVEAPGTSEDALRERDARSPAYGALALIERTPLYDVYFGVAADGIAVLRAVSARGQRGYTFDVTYDARRVPRPTLPAFQFFDTLYFDDRSAR